MPWGKRTEEPPGQTEGPAATHDPPSCGYHGQYPSLQQPPATASPLVTPTRKNIPTPGNSKKPKLTAIGTHILSEQTNHFQNGAYLKLNNTSFSSCSSPLNYRCMKAIMAPHSPAWFPFLPPGQLQCASTYLLLNQPNVIFMFHPLEYLAQRQTLLLYK